MDTFPLNTIDASGTNDTSLPLIVAKRWNFPLAHATTQDGSYYAIQDWVRGLTGVEDIRNLWNMFKKTDAGRQTYNSIVRLPYVAKDGKTYKRDFTNDKGLYLLAQYLRVKQDRPMLDEIRRFLAASGAFVDALRREPDMLIDSVKNPDKLLEAFIEYHRKRGKDDRWIQMRMDSKIKRSQFTAALAEFVQEELTPRHYATATDDVYRGLWGRTAATLKQDLSLPKSASLRDHQPILALYYQGIVEEVCAQKLGYREELWWDEARDIIRHVATVIGRQAKETGELLQKDIATDKPLLISGLT
ncbi:MAG: hypothetical protein SF123_04620 [Chloroflexota bacterium]|nr:hypothetical protein [Chloroflexota bacterium]